VARAPEHRYKRGSVRQGKNIDTKLVVVESLWLQHRIASHRIASHRITSHHIASHHITFNLVAALSGSSYYLLYMSRANHLSIHPSIHPSTYLSTRFTKQRHIWKCIGLFRPRTWTSKGRKRHEGHKGIIKSSSIRLSSLLSPSFLLSRASPSDITTITSSSL